MALTKALQVFGTERPIVDREQRRRQYSSLEYLLGKAVAEIPLDTLFSVLFTTTLKSITGIRIGWGQLTAVFSLMTVAGASLGYAIGGWTKKSDSALAMGLPTMVVLMAVGIINPSGVDKSTPPSQLVQAIKMMSPIKWAIEALCVGEFGGVDLRSQTSRWGRIRDLPKVGAFAMVANGDQVLEVLGLENASFEEILRNMAILSGTNLFVSWLGLQVTGTSRQNRRDSPTSKKELVKKKKTTKSRVVNESSQGPSSPMTVPLVR